MTPSVDERLASIVRALTDVILPSLPSDAGLAQEQVQLCIGQIQILRMQIDGAPQFEAEELADAMALGRALSEASGGARTREAAAALASAVEQGSAAKDPVGVRAARVEINGGIAALINAASADGDAAEPGRVSKIILEHETKRALKDRRWFAAFGFDSVPA